MQYQELKSGISEHLNKAAEDFFTIGYFLRQINSGGMYGEDGYKDIWEFAKGEYGLSMSSASRFMAINARFSIDGGQTMEKRYIGMGPSKLQEMLALPEECLKKVTKDMTVRQIRELKKPEQTSYYGLTKSVYPKGSLVGMAGCGNKHTCISCGMECGIRQEERNCRTAPLGSPFPCTQVGNKNLKYSIYKDECMHLDPELAPLTGGSKEPSPCCLECGVEACTVVICDVARERRGDARKKEEAERRQKQRDWQKEAEAAKRDMTEKELKELYHWMGIGKMGSLRADKLRELYGKTYRGGSSDSAFFRCTPRGVRAGDSKEMTWGALVKELGRIKEEDAQGREPSEEECIISFYESLYPSEMQQVRERNKAVVTKAFKQEHGEAFVTGRHYSCYPDKIVLNPGGNQRQITWGRFVQRLFRLLDDRPQIEDAPIRHNASQESALEPQGQEEPDAIDVDFEEVDAEGDGGEATPEPEAYGYSDVSDLLIKYQKDLKDYKDECCPEPAIKKLRIQVDALTLLKLHMKGDGEG